MFVKTLRLALALLSGQTLLISCSTDVELNAPKDTKTLVFGLLDSKADTQFIKINRSFLGDGNNLLYAEIRDSVEYAFSDFTATVHGLDGNGSTVHSFQLDSISVQKLPGLFAERQTVYFFVTDQLNPNLEYELRVEFLNGEETVTARTNLIEALEGDNNISSPGEGQGVKLVTQNPGQDNVTYNELFRIKFQSTANAKRYDAKLRFHWVEKTWSGTPYDSDLQSSEPRFIDWSLGTSKIDNPEASTEIDYRVSGKAFFNLLSTALGSTSDNISREIGRGAGLEEECFDFILTVGNDELNTWLEVNQPVTGIISERPVYSNIEGGLGLLASRTSQGKYLLRTYGSGVNAVYDPKTKHEICLGLMTYQLRFCSVFSTDQEAPFYFDNRGW